MRSSSNYHYHMRVTAATDYHNINNDDQHNDHYLFAIFVKRSVANYKYQLLIYIHIY